MMTNVDIKVTKVSQKISKLNQLNWIRVIPLAISMKIIFLFFKKVKMMRMRIRIKSMEKKKIKGTDSLLKIGGIHVIQYLSRFVKTPYLGRKYKKDILRERNVTDGFAQDCDKIIFIEATVFCSATELFVSVPISLIAFTMLFIIYEFVSVSLLYMYCRFLVIVCFVSIQFY